MAKILPTLAEILRVAEKALRLFVRPKGPTRFDILANIPTFPPTCQHSTEHSIDGKKAGMLRGMLECLMESWNVAAAIPAAFGAVAAVTAEVYGSRPKDQLRASCAQVG